MLLAEVHIIFSNWKFVLDSFIIGLCNEQKLSIRLLDCLKITIEFGEHLVNQTACPIERTWNLGV